MDFHPMKKYGGVGPIMDLDSGYIVVLQHPVTTQYEAAQKQATATLEAVAELKIPALWFWPNVDAGSDGTSKAIRSFREDRPGELIHYFRHVDSIDFLRLLKNSHCIIGNSSVAIRECAYLGVPAINIGGRQMGRERGKNVRDVSHDREAILAATREHMATGHFPSDPIYGHGDGGQRIAERLAGPSPTIEKMLTY
jgi:UDP-N-acetylglucosamine 2-epimerase